MASSDNGKGVFVPQKLDGWVKACLQNLCRCLDGYGQADGLTLIEIKLENNFNSPVFFNVEEPERGFIVWPN
ncbi:hypothetical protein RC74_13275 [Falsihalocynthiibacter arcticus]|uniref:Uncharacterized protein n=1 Tax=Falsihalocynthiibacter arcticus TaxID=1579316 RepID=A0A126V1R6_9RHOB|nr:hypothetical protein RC74_13275 [Falsihalocynthiibacter arcticus]